MNGLAYLCLFLFLFVPQVNGQLITSEELKALSDVELGKTNIDFRINTQHRSKTSRLTHIYFEQLYEGIPIKGTRSSIHLNEGNQVVRKSDKFIKSKIEFQFNKNSIINYEDALGLALAELGVVWLGVPEDVRFLNERIDVKIAMEGFEDQWIPMRKIMIQDQEDSWHLAWELYLFDLQEYALWEITIDALNGIILSKDDRMKNCIAARDLAPHPMVFGPSPQRKNHGEEVPADLICEQCYEVFAEPVESPYYGERRIVIEPAHPIASPYGWHDLDGVPGSDSMVSKGNNADVRELDDNSGYRPNGGSELDFTGFPFDANYTPQNQYEDASLTNLFYWTNLLHDVFYVFGFDEDAGNFQSNNYGRGGTDLDPMKAGGQRSIGRCNAHFGFAPEGLSPIMILGTCDNHDGSYDNIVIAHEYGHGITSRLVGGPYALDCLDNEEQMDEGWSDWFGTILTIEEGDVGTDRRPIANFYINRPPSTRGIRRYPYSTDPDVNPFTYSSIKTEKVPHGVGSVWANMLWEMTWELIDNYGFDSNPYNYTGTEADAGNVRALAIVLEGLKLTPCQPGFVDARDAIIDADLALYNGANNCQIWNAFSRRGLGTYASQGSSDSKLDGLEDYTGIPPKAQLNFGNRSFCVDNDSSEPLTGGIPIGGVYSGPGIVDLGNGRNFRIDLNQLEVGEHTFYYEIVDGPCTVASTDEATFSVIKDTVAPAIRGVVKDLDVRLPRGHRFYTLADYWKIFEADDFCSANLELVQDPEPGTALELGVHPISLIAIDGAGNEQIAQFDLFILESLEGTAEGNREANALNLIEFAPNPTRGSIVLNNPFNIMIVAIQLMDNTGRFVARLPINSGNTETEVNLDFLNAGSYFIRIETENLQKLEQLVKF